MSILGYRSRIEPRVSPRALTLTQLDTLALDILGGVSRLGMLHGPNHTSATNVPVKLRKVQTGQHHRRDATDDAVSFRVQLTDAHSRRLVSDDQIQTASVGLDPQRLDGLGRRCGLIRQLWLRFRLYFDELMFFSLYAVRAALQRPKST